MEGQGNQGFSREPVPRKDSFGDANRLKRYALSALKHIEKESKRYPQSGHPISYLGEIAGNKYILQFLYNNHQGLALEHNGRRVTYSVVKDPNDSEDKRLIIQGLGFEQDRWRQTLDIEWYKKYGTMVDKGDIEALEDLTRQDVVRSVRRAIIERYDPYKYKNESLSGAINLGMNRIAEVSGARMISGAISDRIADSIDDSRYRKEREKATTSPSDWLRRERRRKTMKEAVVTLGGLVAAGTIVAAGIHDYQRQGVVRGVVGKSVGIVEKVSGDVASRFSGLGDKNLEANVPSVVDNLPEVTPTPTSESPKSDTINKVPSDSNSKLRGLIERINNSTPAELAIGMGAVLAAGAVAAGAEVGRRKLMEKRKKKKKRKALLRKKK